MTTAGHHLREREVTIPIERVHLPGTLTTPEDAVGLVLFAHGSGSSRLSPRNQYVARELNSHGLATLLFDMLTESEAAERANVFDIDLLATRLRAATTWVSGEPEVIGFPIGYFGASTGAAAALVAAARAPAQIRAVVSRGGRPDLAASSLEQVRAPTLLIVGGHDEPVIGLNSMALERLATPVKRMVVVPGATHLFEEPGTLERVAALAGEFFLQHLPVEHTRPPGIEGKMARLRAILR